MTKRLIDVDDRLVEQAKAALGTKTLKDTVNEALAAALKIRRKRVGQSLDALAKLGERGVLRDRSDAW